MERRSSQLQPDHKLAGLGLLLMVPALALCLGGALQSFLGAAEFNDTLETFKLDSLLFNPVVLLGGLFLAFVLNLVPVARLKIADGSLTGTIQLRGKVSNLGILSGVGFLLGIIILYLVAENFQIFAR
jgi:hypothetical protein